MQITWKKLRMRQLNLLYNSMRIKYTAHLSAVVCQLDFHIMLWLELKLATTNPLKKNSICMFNILKLKWFFLL